uniref:C3H1-type domain-containing protein n=1 Tax=Parastrongyloides trichosuri TaxID=131310 RepID=A0A0N4ZWX0_PARTI
MPVTVKNTKIYDDNGFIKIEADSSTSQPYIPKLKISKSLLRDKQFKRMSVEDISNQDGMIKAYDLIKDLINNKNNEGIAFYLKQLAQVEFTDELANCTDLLLLLNDIYRNKECYNNDICQLIDPIRKELRKYCNDKVDTNNSLETSPDSTNNQNGTTKKRNKPIVHQGKRRLTGLYGENDNISETTVTSKKTKKSDVGSMTLINDLLDQTVSSGPSFGESLNKVKQKKTPIKKRGPQIIDPISLNENKSNSSKNDEDELNIAIKKPNKKGHNIRFLDEVYPHKSIVEIKEFELIPNERTHFQPNMNSNIDNDCSKMNEGTVMKRHFDKEDDNSETYVEDVEPYVVYSIDTSYIENIPLSYKEANPDIYGVLSQNNPVLSNRTYEMTPEFLSYLEKINEERSTGLKAFHDKTSIANLQDETIQKLELSPSINSTIDYIFQIPQEIISQETIQPIENKQPEPEKTDTQSLMEKIKRCKSSSGISSLMAKLREQGVLKTTKDTSNENNIITKTPEKKTLILDVNTRKAEVPTSAVIPRGSWELASNISQPQATSGWASMSNVKIENDNMQKGIFSESRARSLSIVPCKFYEKGSCHFNLECENLHGDDQTVGYKRACGLVVPSKKKNYDYDRDKHNNSRRIHDIPSRRRPSPQSDRRRNYDDNDRGRKRRVEDDGRRSSNKRTSYESKYKDDEYDVVTDRRYLTASHV